MSEMYFLFFLISLVNVLNQDLLLDNINLYDFYIECNSSNYTIDIYPNNISELIIKQFPLRNKVLSKEQNALSINLNSVFNIDENDRNVITFLKGNIISDGTKISLIYKYSESDFSYKNYSLIGNFISIDKLIEIFDNTKDLISINVISSCISSIVSFEKTIIIYNEALSFQLFSRKTLPFLSIPYLYFNNNYELSKYCSIENNYLSILCTFDNEMYEKYEGFTFYIFELIPGCESPINTEIIIDFSILNCEKYIGNGNCSECYSGYIYNEEEKKCIKQKETVLALLLVIIFIFIILPLAFLIYFCCCRKN